eukprot:TRINITY_DN64129_c0_g1_i1.p1 TRINITY_DN64129_c0_g1~~TRINITY_DN64129_c0_g1_i1.p1  ORF type:complete len:319 (-),score=15.05 TRINITY_DN64129_c0_g1_i1:201-1112(-)
MRVVTLLLSVGCCAAVLPFQLPAKFELLGDGTLSDVTYYYKEPLCNCRLTWSSRITDCSGSPTTFSVQAGNCTIPNVYMPGSLQFGIVVARDGSYQLLADCNGGKTFPYGSSFQQCTNVDNGYYTQLTCSCAPREVTTTFGFTLYELQDGASCNSSLQVVGRSSSLDYKVVHNHPPVTSPIPFAHAVGFVPNTSNCTDITVVPSWCLSSWYNFLPFSSGLPGHMSGLPYCNGTDSVYYRMMQWATGSNIQLCVNNHTGTPTWISYSGLKIEGREWSVDLFIRNIIKDPYIAPGVFDSPDHCKL